MCLSLQGCCQDDMSKVTSKRVTSSSKLTSQRKQARNSAVDSFSQKELIKHRALSKDQHANSLARHHSKTRRLSVHRKSFQACSEDHIEAPPRGYDIRRRSTLYEPKRVCCCFCCYCCILFVLICLFCSFLCVLSFCWRSCCFFRTPIQSSCLIEFVVCFRSTMSACILSYWKEIFIP